MMNKQFPTEDYLRKPELPLQTVNASNISHPTMPDIVGVWNVEIKIDALLEGFEGFYTFFADGNFIDVNAYKETNPGKWMRDGNIYALTVCGFLFDENGKANGKAFVRASIQMDDADHFTAQGVTDTFDMAGKVTKNPFAGPFKFTGTRISFN